MDVDIDDIGIGRIDIDLFADTPVTSENFYNLCVGKMSFKGSSFHHVKPYYRAVGGIVHGYGKPFDDENFKFKHTRGVLSMENNNQKDNNTSMFFICLRDTPLHDGTNTVFGEV